MNKIWAAIAPVIVLALASCGGKREETPAAVSGAEATTNSSATSPVAQSGHKRMADCAGVRAQAAPAGQPADDVMGVRIGMSLAEARKVIACANPIYVFSEQEGQWHRDGKAPIRRVALQADGGLDDMLIDSAGSAGAERVVRLARSMEYAQGKEQAHELIKTTIEKKYGPLDTLSGYGPGGAGAAVYSADGQRLGTDNSDYSRCVGNAGEGVGSSVTLANCGLVVKYRIQPASNDPALARSFNVVVFDGGKALRLLDEIEASGRSAAQKAAETGEAPKI